MKKLILIVLFIFSVVGLVMFMKNKENYDFDDNDMYAIKFLGYNYDLENSEYKKYDYYPFSGDEYYLIIPRYDDVDVKLYELNIENDDKKLMYESKSNAFVVRCNESDIFSNLEIELKNEKSHVKFSPFISLKDGLINKVDEALIIK